MLSFRAGHIAKLRSGAVIKGLLLNGNFVTCCCRGTAACLLFAVHLLRGLGHLAYNIAKLVVFEIINAGCLCGIVALSPLLGLVADIRHSDDLSQTRTGRGRSRADIAGGGLVPVNCFGSLGAIFLIRDTAIGKAGISIEPLLSGKASAIGCAAGGVMGKSTKLRFECGHVRSNPGVGRVDSTVNKSASQTGCAGGACFNIGVLIRVNARQTVIGSCLRCALAISIIKYIHRGYGDRTVGVIMRNCGVLILHATAFFDLLGLNMSDLIINRIIFTLRTFGTHKISGLCESIIRRSLDGKCGTRRAELRDARIILGFEPLTVRAVVLAIHLLGRLTGLRRKECRVRKLVYARLSVIGTSFICIDGCSDHIRTIKIFLDLIHIAVAVIVIFIIQNFFAFGTNKKSARTDTTYFIGCPRIGDLIHTTKSIILSSLTCTRKSVTIQSLSLKCECSIRRIFVHIIEPLFAFSPDKHTARAFTDQNIAISIHKLPVDTTKSTCRIRRALLPYLLLSLGKPHLGQRKEGITASVLAQIHVLFFGLAQHMVHHIFRGSTGDKVIAIFCRHVGHTGKNDLPVRIHAGCFCRFHQIIKLLLCGKRAFLDSNSYRIITRAYFKLTCDYSKTCRNT